MNLPSLKLLRPFFKKEIGERLPKGQVRMQNNMSPAKEGLMPIDVFDTLLPLELRFIQALDVFWRFCIYISRKASGK